MIIPWMIYEQYENKTLNLLDTSNPAGTRCDFNVETTSL